jgi:PLP dependent protein
MSTIAENLQHVHERMVRACQQAHRPEGSVRLLAVSKTWGPEAVLAAWRAGQTAFGENYVQEGVDKINWFRNAGVLGLEWHCIGPLQSNKTRAVAEHFDWVHTVDRLKIAQRLSEQRPAELPPLQICLQVNVDAGANKSGVAPQELLPLAQAVAELPRLRLRGLMCIPEPAHDFASACEVLGGARALFEGLRAAGHGVDTLSMGMSNDLEAAIASGSTMVRVGSALFGARSHPGA